ncbi:hypothetical protein N7450_005607 [Penicillium hetheringtonii]|uniref:C2H2-type domain-containing protein n=1 Tax=Penicillium hetheringtonii TaxID=911720 RepID=A0AAD6DIU1_9EURO|nr:hypothetical protein N7450_005607 [Penicillium hetheringtonii]
MLAIHPQSKSTYFQPMPMDPNMVDMFSFPIDGMPYQQQQQQPQAQAQPPPDFQISYMDGPIYEDLQKQQFPSMPATPPSVSTSQSEPQIPTGSAASGPSIASAPSSAISSPYSGTQHVFQDNWVNTNHGLGLPAVVMGDLFSSHDYMGHVDMEALYQEKFPDPFVGTSIFDPTSSIYSQLHPNHLLRRPTILILQHSPKLPPTLLPDASPISYNDNLDHQSSPHQNQTLPRSSMIANTAPSRPVSVYDRRSSISSIRSRRSQQSPTLSTIEADDDTKEKGRCPFPDCGRIFKDLKAHMLTHQSERPEKCPILTCEYHTKGFARKYDKNRHTLTHYKGTMVCGFCPGPGSPAEKSFNRADVFKRHLTSVHGVEQTPPNCRKRSPNGGSSQKGTNYSPDATGKCSTCSITFSNAQDFYEHLDDCVLRVVQQEEPSEAINQQRLAEVASDEEVQKTMEKHQLLDSTGSFEEDDSHDEDDFNDLWRNRKSKSSASAPASRVILGSNNAVSKNVRLRLPGGAGDGTHRDAYVTDLDVETMKRAEGVLSASDAERGPWMDGGGAHLMGRPAMLLPELGRQDDEISINELMA